MANRYYAEYQGAGTTELWRYCGSRLMRAELFAFCDFGEPERVARTIVDPSYRLAFREGADWAVDNETSLPEPDGGSAFFRELCRQADVR